MIIKVRSDHGKKLENEEFYYYCDEEGINMNYQPPRHHNRMEFVEWKNKIMPEERNE